MDNEVMAQVEVKERDGKYRESIRLLGLSLGGGAQCHVICPAKT